MLTLRTIAIASLVFAFTQAAQAQFGGDAVKGKPRDRAGQRSGDKVRDPRGIAWGGPTMLKEGATRKAKSLPSAPPMVIMPDPGIKSGTGATRAASNGPTIVPTSNSAVKAKAAAGGLQGDPDRPMGWTDDNGSPSELGLSVKSRSGGDKFGPRERRLTPGCIRGVGGVGRCG